MVDGAVLKAVKEVLPHREPFLFIDEVISLEDNRIKARRLVRADEPQFLGHYPERPVMPGVLLCEAVLQTGAYLMAHKMGIGADMAGVPAVTRMNQVRFKRIVKPGDHLELEAEHIRSMMGAHVMKGAIRCEGKLVCSLEFMVMLVPEGETA